MNIEHIKVLLIEDNPGDARLVEEMLAEARDMHFDLRCFNRLSAGLEQIKEYRPDVILLDLTLPDCQGSETVATAKARADGAPLVVLTGMEDERLGLKLVKEGAQDYLVKGEFDGRLLSRSLYYSIERKRNEKLAAARDAALETSRLKSLFLANMSHEIRTPMNAVIGMTRLLLDTQLSPRQKELTQTIWSSARSLLEIINDILDLSKISAGKVEFQETDLDIGEVIGGVTSMFAEQAENKKLALISRIDTRTPRSLRGDPGRLRQVLVNLIGNAIKFTDKGEVVVAVEPEAQTEEDAMLHFVVADTGCGIPAEAMDRLFRPFSQADNSTTRKYSGTGLGLAISAQLIERMGGTVGVESWPGEGSRFWFTVKLRKQPTGRSGAGAGDARVALHAAAGPATEHAVKQLADDKVSDGPSPRRICSPASHRDRDSGLLIVEDNPTNQKVALWMLESLGYKADLVPNGREAIAALSRARYDLVLMDCQMPEMDGYEATKTIRASENGSRHTTIIGMTANAIQGDRETCLAAGMDDYIAKPVILEELAALLDKWLASGRSRNGSAPGSSRPGSDRAPAPCEANAEVFDTALLETFRRVKVGGAPNLLCQLIDMFLADLPSRLESIRTSVAADDPTTLRANAHALKGSCGSIGAKALLGVCGELEARARRGCLSEASALLQDLEVQAERVRLAFEAEKASTQVL